MLRERSTESRATARRRRATCSSSARDRPAVRARLIELAAELQWLTPDERRSELMAMINDELASPVISAADVDLVAG